MELGGNVPGWGDRGWFQRSYDTNGKGGAALMSSSSNVAVTGLWDELLFRGTHTWKLTWAQCSLTADALVLEPFPATPVGMQTGRRGGCVSPDYGVSGQLSHWAAVVHCVNDWASACGIDTWTGWLLVEVPKQLVLSPWLFNLKENCYLDITR